jgi:hypothetical protein
MAPMCAEHRSIDVWMIKPGSSHRRKPRAFIAAENRAKIRRKHTRLVAGLEDDPFEFIAHGTMGAR